MQSTPREALIKSLKGQKIRIYDLDKVMTGWPSVVNPNIEILREDVQVRITKYATSDHSTFGLIEKRQLLLDEIKLFLDSQSEEQNLALQADLPTVEQYRYNRMGTSAVGILLAINE
ncbi:MAG: hypothetical protein Q9195_008030 [Heterodermia aff. obscurata]